MGIDCLPKDFSIEKSLTWGFFVYHCEQAGRGSLENRVIHVIMAILEFFPLIGQIVSFAELLIIECVRPLPQKTLSSREISPLTPIEIMHKFWQERVCSFKICHGTNSLYLAHFRQHGISATYPAALDGLVSKIRRVWGSHQLDVMHKTEYFRAFESRYDRARQTNRIAFSFSAKPSITSEFTVGARRGGEWIRDLRTFIREAWINKHLFLEDEWNVVLEANSFIELLDSLPPLVVKVHAGCPDLAYKRLKPLFSTFESFVEAVQQECANWQNLDELSQYLEQSLRPQLERLQEGYRNTYEVTINFPIRPEHLEFELVGGERRPLPLCYPQLAFDQPAIVSDDEVFALRIHRSGFSYREEYRDSRFSSHYNYVARNLTIVRRRLTEQDRQDLALWMRMREMQKAWLRAFDCHVISPEEV